MMAWAPSITALSPDPQTLFTVRPAASMGIPALIIACLAGFWPRPVGRTFPMMTSSTSSFVIFARLITSFITILPSSNAEISLKIPLKSPIGVRTALKMTTFFINTPVIITDIAALQD